MLQSEYDAIVRHKRLKIFLIILTAIMVVAVVLFVRKQFFVVEPNGSPKSDEKTELNPVVIRTEHFELQGAERDAFLKSDSPEAQALRDMIEFQSLQK